MDTIISREPEETVALGAAWGRAAAAGWILALTGELGAGKTQLVRGIARGLEIAQPVHSPTFTLLNAYAGGRLPLFHLDLYRLNGVDDLVPAGLLEYLPSADGVTVVEWAERWWNGVAAGSGEFRVRRVWIEITGDRERCIRYEDAGS